MKTVVTESPFAPDALVLAPLAGYTDLPFRRACRRYGCTYAFTPLVDAGSVVYQNPRNATLLQRGDEEPWLGVQLLGSTPDLLARATRLLASHEFDVFDLNMGCPVPKVIRRSAGAVLCEDPDLAAQCVEAVANVCARPVTAKIRVLSADDPEPTVRLASRLEQSGVAALTVHGRVREAYYSGPVAVDVIRAVAEVLQIPVIANGGVFDRVSAERLRLQTGCSRLMIARGAIGNPWVFREVRNHRGAPASHDEVCDELERHVRGMADLYGEGVGMRQARKIILAYLRGRGYRKDYRRHATGLSTLSDFLTLLAEVRAGRPSARFDPEHDGRAARWRNAVRVPFGEGGGMFGSEN